MNKNKKNICVFCSTFVGLETVIHLLEGNYPLGLVAVPDYGSNQQLVELCKESGVKCSLVDDAVEEINDGEFYWLINAWCSKILKANLLSKFNKRINFHPSFIPWGRGSHSASWSLLEDSKFGVSLIEMEEDIDAGKIYAQREIKFDLMTRASELSGIAKKKLCELFKDRWHEIYSGNVLLIDPETYGSGSYHLIKELEETRLLKLEQQTTVENFIRIVNAHDFLPTSGAKVKIQGDFYSIKIELKKL